MLPDFDHKSTSDNYFTNAFLQHAIICELKSDTYLVLKAWIYFIFIDCKLILHEEENMCFVLKEALIWETELAVVLFVLSLTPCLEKGLTRWIRFCGKTRATITGKFSDVISSTDPCGAAAMPLHTLSSTHPSSFIRDVWQIPLNTHWAKCNCEKCSI